MSATRGGTLSFNREFLLFAPNLDDSRLLNRVPILKGSLVPPASLFVDVKICNLRERTVNKAYQ